MAAPGIFTPVAGGWGRQGWTTVSLTKIGVPELKQALEMAWCHAQPKGRKTARGRRG